MDSKKADACVCVSISIVRVLHDDLPVAIESNTGLDASPRFGISNAWWSPKVYFIAIAGDLPEMPRRPICGSSLVDTQLRDA